MNLDEPNETMNPFKITIDQRELEVRPGQSILEAARQLGIEIPNLCLLEKSEPLTSCLVCLVKVISNGQSRLMPACGIKVVPDMRIESETDEVHQARRTALELLFSDHVGDCLSPCQRLCPLQLNIPVMIRQIQAGHIDPAIVTVRESLPLPAVVARLCHHPCEQGCRRGAIDQPAAIRDLERLAADTALRQHDPHLPKRDAPTGKSVVVIGSGPAGLSAGITLACRGHRVTVVDRQDKPGGALRAAACQKDLPPDVLDAEIAQITRLGIQIKTGLEFGTQVTIEGLLRGFDAVLIAVGDMAKGEPERLGLTAAPTGIQVDSKTWRTPRPNVFAVGAAVKPAKQLVRVMADGRAAAECIHQFLAGEPVQLPEKPFSSVIGRLEPAELKLFLKNAPAQSAFLRCDSGAGLTKSEAVGEASRCLHCDCRSAGNCLLQQYGMQYGVDTNRFRGERRRFEQDRQTGGVIFEPGKCILCGICVKLTQEAREPLGLTFVGRGFEVRVAAPFDRSIEEGLRSVAAQCVQQCPTGALAFETSNLSATV